MFLMRLSIALFVILLVTPSALAESDTPPSAAPARVSVGAGIGFRGFGSSPLFLAPYGGPAAYSLSGVGLVELVQDERVRWTLAVHGSFFKQFEEAEENTGYVGPNTGTASAVGGWLGVRRVINPGAVVEVSPMVTIGAGAHFLADRFVGGISDPDGNFTPSLEDSSGYSVRADLAFVFEHQLAQGLWLRFENHVAGLGFTRSLTETATGEDVTRRRQKSVTAGVGWSPILQLRMGF